MVAVAGGPSLADRPRTWNLFFARQPEPDLEFTEEWLDETTTIRSPLPIKPPKQSNSRPLLWVLLFVLVGGGAYVAMEPEMVTEYLGPLLDETPAPQPPVARKPAPPTAAPSKQPEQDWSFLASAETTAPASPAPASAPTATASSPAKMPPPAAPSKQVEQDVAFLAKIESIRRERNSVPGTRGAPVPMFREGQRVSVRPDLNAPGWTVLLRQDAEGTQPGPTIPPGTAVIILDGELQGRSWIYFVRSDVGSEGWLAEGQLRLKR